MMLTFYAILKFLLNVEAGQLNYIPTIYYLQDSIKTRNTSDLFVPRMEYLRRYDLKIRTKLLEHKTKCKTLFIRPVQEKSKNLSIQLVVLVHTGA